MACLRPGRGTYLATTVMFVNGAKGKAALEQSRDLDIQYKTAFVLEQKQKLWEAVAKVIAATGTLSDRSRSNAFTTTDSDPTGRPRTR